MKFNLILKRTTPTNPLKNQGGFEEEATNKFFINQWVTYENINHILDPNNEDENIQKSEDENIPVVEKGVDNLERTVNDDSIKEEQRAAYNLRSHDTLKLQWDKLSPWSITIAQRHMRLQQSCYKWFGPGCAQHCW